MAEACFVFAGGGTGGHLFPGLAVAAALQKRCPQTRIVFLTTTRALDRQLLASGDHEQIAQPVRPFSLNPLRLPAFYVSWRRSLSLARQCLRRHRPRAVLGLGGYAAGPAVVVGRQLGIRTAILNPDAIPGRANRYLGHYADVIVLQWDAARTFFPPNSDCRTLGCPIRADFSIAEVGEGRRRFNLRPDLPVLLVTGASQGARTINQALATVWPQFHAAHPDWQLLHLTGPADEATVREAYAVAGAPAQVVAFTHEMAWALAAADVVISRAGAVTLAELTALGKPAILLPYPYHPDRHQHANARVLVERGAGILLEDRLRPELNASALRAALEELADERRRARMSAAARELGRPHAADEVAELLLKLT